MSKFAELLIKEMESLKDLYEVCGMIDKNGKVYALGADTKVLSTIFELISRPAVYRVAKMLELEVVEPSAQNHYPDFTLHKDIKDKAKIAVDVKTTYRNKSTDSFGYTLGGYTSFIREGKEHKNIVYPFNLYKEHWVIGFVYDRVPAKAAAADHIFEVDQVKNIPLPFKNVEVFIQEKWRISSGRAGSGNTTNIGSNMARLMISDRARLIQLEEEFLNDWRGYGRTAGDRKEAYSTMKCSVRG